MAYSVLARTRAKILAACTFGVVFSLSPSSASSEERCSQEMNSLATSSLSAASTSWGSLLKHQKKFAACDDGELGEGYSDSVVRLFARRWDQFNAFAAIAKNDKAFLSWTIRHVDASASTQDLEDVVKNSTSCEKKRGSENLCRKIRKAAEDALAESAGMQRSSNP